MHSNHGGPTSARLRSPEADRQKESENVICLCAHNSDKFNYWPLVYLSSRRQPWLSCSLVCGLGGIDLKETAIFLAHESKWNGFGGAAALPLLHRPSLGKSWLPAWANHTMPTGIRLCLSGSRHALTPSTSAPSETRPYDVDSDVFIFSFFRLNDK